MTTFINRRGSDSGELSAAPYMELHAATPEIEVAGFHDAITARAPRTWHDQPEVQAAIEFERVARLLGTAATSEGAPSLLDRFDFRSREIGALKVRRMQAIGQQIGKILATETFAGNYGQVKMRAKDAKSILDKLAWRTMEVGDKSAQAICDLYGVRIVMWDRHQNKRHGRLFDENDLWNMLREIQAHFGSPDIGPDGQPALRSGGNPKSADGYRDQKAVLTTLVDGNVVPFEVQIFTESGYADYLKTHPQYRRTKRSWRTREEGDW